jgi:hypothetical protein
MIASLMVIAGGHCGHTTHKLLSGMLHETALGCKGQPAGRPGTWEDV